MDRGVVNKVNFRTAGKRCGKKVSFSMAENGGVVKVISFSMAGEGWTEWNLPT
jgi:hypothetical protein